MWAGERILSFILSEMKSFWRVLSSKLAQYFMWFNRITLASVCRAHFRETKTGMEKSDRTLSQFSRQEKVVARSGPVAGGVRTSGQILYTQVSMADVTAYLIDWISKVRERQHYQMTSRSSTRATSIYFIHLLLYLVAAQWYTLFEREKPIQWLYFFILFYYEGSTFLHEEANKKRELAWEEWNNGKSFFGLCPLQASIHTQYYSQ